MQKPLVMGIISKNMLESGLTEGTASPATQSALNCTIKHDGYADG